MSALLESFLKHEETLLTESDGLITPHSAAMSHDDEKRTPFLIDFLITAILSVAMIVFLGFASFDGFIAAIWLNLASFETVLNYILGFMFAGAIFYYALLAILHISRTHSKTPRTFGHLAAALALVAILTPLGYVFWQGAAYAANGLPRASGWFVVDAISRNDYDRGIQFGPYATASECAKDATLTNNYIVFSNYTCVKINRVPEHEITRGYPLDPPPISLEPLPTPPAKI